MTHKALPPILVCPLDRSPLAQVDEQLVARINRAIAAGRVTTRSGRLVDQPISGGLIRADKTLLYPVSDDIPILIADEAIPLAQLSS